jgi:hypothetical protein
MMGESRIEGSALCTLCTGLPNIMANVEFDLEYDAVNAILFSS